jgi:hypothetical protein
MNKLVGLRAVFTKITRQWDAALGRSVETGSKRFHGTIVAIVTQEGWPRIAMLYDDGSLGCHPLNAVTVEAEPAGYRDPGVA